MKKLIYLSGVAAALLFIGCGGGGSGNTEGGVSVEGEASVYVPKFVSKEAAIESSEDVAKALVSLNTNITPQTSTAQNISTILKEGEIGDILNGKIKIASLVDKKNLIKLKALNTPVIQKMVVYSQESLNNILSEEVCQERNEEKELNDYCNISGSAKITTSVKRDENFCIYTMKIEASECVFEEEDDNNGVYKGSVDGSITYKTKAYIPQNAQSDADLKIVDFLFDSDYEFELEGEDVNGEKFAQKEIADLVDYYLHDYAIVSGEFVYTNKIVEKIKGTYDITQKLNGVLNFDLEFKSDIGANITFTDNNAFSILLDGWIEESVKIPQNEVDYYFGIGADNFIASFKLDSDILTSEYSGKLGTTCTNGLLNFDTVTEVEDNINDSYLPYKGYLILTGANDTKAEIKFLTDEDDRPYAVVNVNGQEKVYRSYEEIAKDAAECATGELIIP